MENILESYKTGKDEGKSSCDKLESSSIFDEFEKTITVKSTSLSQSCSSSTATEYDISSKISSICPKEPKRRKICVKLRSANELEVKNESSTEKWRKYLLEVKSLLTSDKYNKFCSAIKEYKATKDVQQFSLTLTNVFMEIPNAKKYIQTASLLVDSKQRENFLSICF